MSSALAFVDGLVFHVVGFKKVDEIGLRRRAGLHADLAAVELERRLEVPAFGNEKRLPVVIGHAREHDAVVALATHRPGRIARQHVDLLVLQRVEPRSEADSGTYCTFDGIVEDRRRERPAEIDVEARPLAIGVLARKALQARVDAADERAAILDGLERLGLGGDAERQRPPRGREQSGSSCA